MAATATVAQVEAYAASVAAARPTFTVRPNTYGVRIECPVCHESASANRSTQEVPEMPTNNRRPRATASDRAWLKGYREALGDVADAISADGYDGALRWIADNTADPNVRAYVTAVRARHNLDGVTP
jgi:hypothetical protein